MCVLVKSQHCVKTLTFFCLFVCDLMLHFALQYINVDVLMVQKET